MNRVHHLAVEITSLILLLWAGPSWAQVPPNNDRTVNGNTAGGAGALQQTRNVNAANNTAFGGFALGSNIRGARNTAFGFNALRDNFNGDDNTATGFQALFNNTIGMSNSAVGARALQNSIEGSRNTAMGFDALRDNFNGEDNTAIGTSALRSNVHGGANTAVGVESLAISTESGGNTAIGFGTLGATTVGGDNNVAAGGFALGDNSTGSFNVAIGSGAFRRAVSPTIPSNTTGSFNIAIGWIAGNALQQGDGNIYLGNQGPILNSSESSTMRLGETSATRPNLTPLIERTFIAGISGVGISGSMVLINGEGQLGIQASSARYKRDIQTMGTRSQELLRLRPVTFSYKQDVHEERQYGLIAEEVATIYPELVTRGSNGEIESVRYHELIPMLLNELQQQQRQQNELKAQNSALGVRVERLEEAVTRAAATQRR